MTISRYNRDGTILAGGAFGTATAVNAIRQAVSRGEINLQTRLLSEAQRLDTIAGEAFGDASLWWVIAAASNIGWALQVPAGTELSIPTDLTQIGDLVG